LDGNIYLGRNGLVQQIMLLPPPVARKLLLLLKAMQWIPISGALNQYCLLLCFFPDATIPICFYASQEWRVAGNNRVADPRVSCRDCRGDSKVAHSNIIARSQPATAPPTQTPFAG
jgi:hypothetical protein